MLLLRGPKEENRWDHLLSKLLVSHACTVETKVLHFSLFLYFLKVSLKVHHTHVFLFLWLPQNSCPVGSHQLFWIHPWLGSNPKTLRKPCTIRMSILQAFFSSIAGAFHSLMRMVICCCNFLSVVRSNSWPSLMRIVARGFQLPPDLPQITTAWIWRCAFLIPIFLLLSELFNHYITMKCLSDTHGNHVLPCHISTLPSTIPYLCKGPISLSS